MRPDQPPQPHTDSTIQAVLHFVRENHVRAAHYFGLADKGLICALKAEPGFTLTITDYFDLWGSSLRFWGSDGLDESAIPKVPTWLEGVPCYEEGLGEAPMLIFDLGPGQGDNVADMIPQGQRHQGCDFVAVIGEAAKAFLPTRTLRWRRAGEAWLAVKRGPSSYLNR
jgi:hypothetical protein